MSLVSDGTFWTVSPVGTPHVEAYITLNYALGDRNLSASTFSGTTLNGTIIVPIYCALVLFCESSQPARWLKNGQAIEDSDDITQIYYQIAAPENVTGRSDEYKWTNIYRRYNGTVVFKNVTLGTEGNYTCDVDESEAYSSPDELNTHIQIRVQGPPPTQGSTAPQILTSWFDQTRYRYDYNYSFDFICFSPPGHLTIDQYFIFPGNRLVRINEMLNGISVESEVLFDDGRFRMWRTSLNMETRFEHEGDYTFVLEYNGTNGVRTRLSRQLRLIHMKYSYDLAERMLTDTFGTYLMVGRHYKLTFWTDFAFPMIDAEVEMFGQSSLANRGDCGYSPVAINQSYEDCGVISVIKKVATFPNWVNAVDINLRVVKSCSYRMRVWSPCGDTPPQNITTYLNTTAIEGSRFSDHDFSNKQTERTIVESWPDGRRGGAQRFVNESFALRCLVPACDWELLNWCKQKSSKKCSWLLWSNGTIKSDDEHLAEDPDIKINFTHSSNFTVAFEIHIDRVQMRHAGVYGCGVFKPVYKPRMLKKPFRSWIEFPEFQFTLPSVNFELDVQEPIAPHFPDGRQSEVHESVIKRGATTDLSCPVEGNPKPSITWRRFEEKGSKKGSSDFERAVESFAAGVNRTMLTIYEPGDYECHATNRYDENYRRFRVSYESSTSPLPIALAVPGAAVVLSLTIFGLVWMRRRAHRALLKDLAWILKESPADISPDMGTPLNDQTDILPYNTNYEIDRDRFKLVKLIGDGEFGQVFRGELRIGENEYRHVAVKAPRDSMNLQHYQALIGELKIMIHLRPHINVLSLVGACTNDLEQRQLFVLTEYCEKGSLLSHLQDHLLDYEGHNAEREGDSSEYSIRTLLEYAYQAANGMEHLAAWMIIHRDLALRNLLLTHRGVVKIADFGLSREKETTYAYNKFLFRNVRLPIPWMAPESLIRYEYTHKSDVWSFGIVLWELFSCGRAPYTSNGISHKDIIDWLSKGHRLDQPKLATDEMYTLMLGCWSSDPLERPTFSDAKSKIARHLESQFPNSYISLLRLMSHASTAKIDALPSPLIESDPSIGSATAENGELMLERLEPVSWDIQQEQEEEFGRLPGSYVSSGASSSIESSEGQEDNRTISVYRSLDHL